jgi:single-strand DNA-binding protein
MNNLRNSVRLIGRLGQNPDVKKLDNGRALAKCSIATTEVYRTEDGEKKEETHWHNLVAWGKQAEVFEKYATKGKEIAIEGKLTTRSWEDKEGVKRYTTEILVNEVLLLGSKKD